MPKRSAPVAQVKFKRAEPQLFVTDLVRSLSFFTERLGFEVAFTYGEPPFYAQVVRGAAHLNLRGVSEPLVDLSLSHREGYLTASICVDSIEELYREYQRSDVEFHESLRTETWGARSFIVRDGDGNLILFVE